METDSSSASAIEEEEENDVRRAAPVPFLAAPDATSSVPPLNKILAVLERLLCPVMAKGLLPSLEEIKLSNLIWIHVTYYIFLYQRESYSKMLQNARGMVLMSEEELESDYRDVRILDFHKMLGIEDCDIRVQPDLGSMSDKFFLDTCFKNDDSLFHLLEECRSSFKETMPAPQVLQDVYPSSCHREQQLLSILHALEKIALGREYAPPQCAADLQDYKDVRKWIVSFTAYSAAKYEFLKMFGKAEDLAGCKWFHNSFSFPFIMDHNFIPSGHKLASAVELIPEFKFLFSKCEGQLSDIFCAINGNKQVAMDADYSGRDTESYYLPHVGLPQLSEQEIRDFRLKSLRQILSLCAQLASYQWKIGLTTSEVRYYLHILEHVYSSLWLAQQYQFQRFSFLVVNSENGIASLQLPSLPTPGDKMTRKECIVNICKLVNAIKLKSSATMTPTREETQLYRRISELLNLDCMICSDVMDEDLGVACMLDKNLEVTGRVDKNLKAAVDLPESFSSIQMARVNHSLSCIYKKELEFLEELKKNYARMVDMICCSIIPEEWNAKAPSANSSKWIDANRDQILAKLENYFQKPGELEKLEQSIVTLNSVYHLIFDIVKKLWDANSNIDLELSEKPRYAVVLKEIGNARCIYKGPHQSLEELYEAAARII